MKRFIFLSLLILVPIFVGFQLFSWHYSKTYSSKEIDALFEPVTKRYGLNIVYEVGEDFFSPLENSPMPTGPHRGSKVKPVYHRVLASYPEILLQALSKYPDRVVKKHLKAIHFAREIDQAGFKYGGSYDSSRKVMYLVNLGWQSKEESIRTIHHEFSSLLLFQNSFFINPWTDCHPKDFKYLSETYDNWDGMNKARKAFSDSDCYEVGMLTDYGLTNFENDFNEYSEMIFTYPQKFKEIMDKYPRVRSKFLIWLKYYHKIDPVFTEAYLFGQTLSEFE